MNLKLKTKMLEVHYGGLIVEIQSGKLATVYKPNETIGQRLGCFYCGDMTLTEFIEKIKTFTKY